MKTKLLVVLFVSGVLAGYAIAGATYTFNPTPKEMMAKKYFTWGINFILPEGEVITGATLTYYNLDGGNNDYSYTHLLDNPAAGMIHKKEHSIVNNDLVDGKKGNNDYLYTHLLDNPAAGVKRKKDHSIVRDDFAGNGVLVGAWTDNPGGKSGISSLVYDFGALGLLDDLNKYADTAYKKRKSNFGFGIDPDGRYNPRNIEFVITTECVPPVAVVPIPGAIVLGSIGTIFVGWLRRRSAL